jgi:HEAT repeat protein
MNFILIIALLSAGAVPLFGQTIPPAGSEDRLIAVLKSDAPHKEKADACRQLGIIGTKDAVAPLAALLDDEKLSHMARYALEPIPDPAVDEALRDALGRLKGRPLVGVIGSIGVRRDAKAVKPLKNILMQHDSDPQVTHAVVRALGNIGNLAAADTLRMALAHAPAANQLALCEGLFRCAESLGSRGQRAEAIEIYDRLRELDDAPHQVRAGALRGAILTRGQDGLGLLREYLRSHDYIMFSAAVQAAQELPGTRVSRALTRGLSQLPADNQILVIWTLGKRVDPVALLSLYTLARKGEKTVRLEAIRVLPQSGHMSAVPVLVELLADADGEISEAAQEALGALPGRDADAAVMAMFNSSQTSRRRIAIELMGRRRMTDTVGELLKAAGGEDAEIRPAAIKAVGELGGPDELPTLLDLLMSLKASEDLDAARQALSDVCTKAGDPESCTWKLTGMLAKAGPAQKIVLLRVLGGIGGSNALEAVRKAVDDQRAEVHVAAIRALGTWKTADAAPILLALAEAADNPNDKTLCLRGYLGFAARGDVPPGQRLSMCRQARDLIERDDEKRLLLGALGSINSPGALSLIMPYLDDRAIRAEACTATIAIAENLLRRRDSSKLASKLIKPLEKVAQVSTNADLARRAKSLLRQAQKMARGR